MSLVGFGRRLGDVSVAALTQNSNRLSSRMENVLSNLRPRVQNLSQVWRHPLSQQFRFYPASVFCETHPLDGRVGLGSEVGSPSESGQFFILGLKMSDEDKSLRAVIQMTTS